MYQDLDDNDYESLHREPRVQQSRPFRMCIIRQIGVNLFQHLSVPVNERKCTDRIDMKHLGLYNVGRIYLLYKFIGELLCISIQRQYFQ